ncbi:CoA-transferase [Methylomicrobium sp. Wu6]|uniref:CoA transferase subunit A n=1 Tax=Methylomicrobium sp. Wu6 TaxID=3107928 RepID=UPI002DD63A51|nr:CoA-transferase [Methylomicrobium sp. Wu6]MEC4749536.1 CoA-transferase [Methylomicrobium sp. Wu6]
MFTQADKRCSLSELVAQVKDGDVVAVGGGLSWREPMAALRELIRHGRRGLTVVGSAHGIDIDMLCGAGVVAVSGESYVGFEQDFGMAPNYRRACESGAVQVRDNCCYTLVQQLRAAISGLPFMPIRSVQGTGFEALHPEFKTMICPYTGDRLVLVPPLQPDVAVLHAHFADRHGNLHIEGPPVADILFAKASRKVIVTVEEILEHEDLAEKGVTIPYFYVTAVCEVRYGAHPTSCYPNYAYDRRHTQHYYDQARQGAEVFRENYLKPFVSQCPDHRVYLEAIGGRERLNRLTTWRESDEQWRSLYE